MVARDLVGRTLFKESPEPTHAFTKVEAAVLVGGFLVLAVVLQLLRLGLSVPLDSLWAEDGPIFLQDALARSPWDAISTEYSGYIVLFPRLVAEAAAGVPLGEAPAVIAVLAALGVALAGLVVWFASAGHIVNPYLRGTLAALTVLAPVGGLETIATASYSSWYMLFAVFWLLLWRPRGQSAALLGAGFIALTGLSNPGIWFFLPLALLRAACARDRLDATILAGYFLTAGVQIVVALRSTYDAVEPAWTADIWTVSMQRVLDGAALGLRLGGLGWKHLGWVLLIALLVLAVAGLVVGWRRSGWGPRTVAVVALPTAVAMFVASVYQRAVGEAMLWPADVYFGAAGRYAIVPALLLVGVAFVFLDNHEARGGRARRLTWPSLAAIALVAVSAAVSFPAGESAVRGTPSWSKAVDDAERTCARDRLEAAQLPISPPPFSISVACDELISG